jgi:hypothetical protein
MRKWSLQGNTAKEEVRARTLLSPTSCSMILGEWNNNSDRVNKGVATLGSDPLTLSCSWLEIPQHLLEGPHLALRKGQTLKLASPGPLVWQPLLYLPLAIVNPRKISCPANLPLQTPLLYLLQVCEKQWVLALARYSPLQGFFLNQSCAGLWAFSLPINSVPLSV